MRGREWKRRWFVVKIGSIRDRFCKICTKRSPTDKCEMFIFWANYIWDYLDCFEGITILPLLLVVW